LVSHTGEGRRAQSVRKQGAHNECGSKRDEVTRERRRLHNEELYDLFSLQDVIRMIKSGRMTWAEHVACMGEKRGSYRVLAGKPEGKRPLGSPRSKRRNIKMYIQEIGWGGAN